MAGTVALWYRRRFNLPPNHPQYLALSVHDMQVEYWAHKYDDLFHQGKLDDLVENDDFDADLERFLKDGDDAWEEVANDDLSQG